MERTLAIRKQRQAFSVLAAAAALALCWMIAPAQAQAHAVLVSTQPNADEILQSAPSQIRLEFSGEVSLPRDAVRIYGPDGSRVATSRAQRWGATVILPVMANASGTYAVAWRVVSSDGQPQSGRLVYHLGVKSTNALAARSAAGAWADNRNIARVYGVARATLLLSALLAVGAAVFTVLIAPRRRPRLLRMVLVVLVVSASGGYLLQLAVADGLTVSTAAQWQLLRDHAASGYGRAMLVVILLALAAVAFVPLLTARAVYARYVALAVFLALGASLSLSSHASAGGSNMRIGADMIHVLAAATWLGGLFQLAFVLREQPLATAIVSRYSKIVLLAVTLLTASGIYALYEETLLAQDAFTSTEYGTKLLIKLGLVAALIALAAFNRKRLLPRISSDTHVAVGKLRAGVLAETAIMLAVVAVTASLIETVPSKDQLPVGDRQHILVRSNPTGIPVTITPTLGQVDLITIRNAGSKDLMIPAADGTPYARIGPSGTYIDINGGTSHPDWRQLESIPQLSYHDYRIPMLLTLPASVDRDLHKPQSVLQWELPIFYDNRPATLHATVYYTPPDGNIITRNRQTIFAAFCLLILSYTGASRLWPVHARARRVFGSFRRRKDARS